MKYVPNKKKHYLSKLSSKFLCSLKERLLETAIPSRRGLNKKIVHIKEQRVELMSLQIRIKQPSAINIFVLSFIEWWFYTSFTVAALWSITFGFIDIEMCFMICFLQCILRKRCKVDRSIRASGDSQSG